MKRVEGRHGEPTEFVEFQLQKKKLTYVAQRGHAGWWYIFEVHPGLKGTVRTLESFGPHKKEEAVRYALAQATLANK